MRDSVPVIRDSFQTVAEELKLTRDNCPTHPSFVTMTDLLELRKKDITFFGLFINEIQIGFVAVEKADEELYYMEKLAVLPQYRHRGYGRELVNFVFNYVRGNHGNRISIGTIDELMVLKNWYLGLGFKEVSVKKFEHLPFDVCFMEKEVS